MEPNPLREIRDIRKNISSECQNDSDKVFDYYQAQQERMKSTGEYTFVSKPKAKESAIEQSDERRAV